VATEKASPAIITNRMSAVTYQANRERDDHEREPQEVARAAGGVQRDERVGAQCDQDGVAQRREHGRAPHHRVEDDHRAGREDRRGDRDDRQVAGQVAEDRQRGDQQGGQRRVVEAERRELRRVVVPHHERPVEAVEGLEADHVLVHDQPVAEQAPGEEEEGEDAQALPAAARDVGVTSTDGLDDAGEPLGVGDDAAGRLLGLHHDVVLAGRGGRRGSGVGGAHADTSSRPCSVFSQ
jgi:hypothetical protein